MKKAFKIIATLIGIAAALLLATVIIVPLLFNPNEYKDEIAQLVKEQTGRELILQDDLELSLFPWIGVTTGVIELGNARGFGEQPFAHIERAEVKVKLLPLLQKRVEASTVILRGLRLQLTVNEDGTSNWDDLASGDKAAPATQPPVSTAPAAAPHAGAGLAAVAIGGVQIENANIAYDNRAEQQRYQIRQLNLTTGPLLPGTPLTLSLQTAFEATNPELSGQLSLDSQVLLDLAQERYRFDNTRLNTSLHSSDLPNGTAEIDLAASIAVDMKQQTASLTGLNLKSYGIDLSGDLNLQQLFGEPTFSGRLNVAEFSPRNVMQQLQIELPETADVTVLNSFSASFQLSGTTNIFNLTQLAMVLDQSRIDGELKATLNDAPLPAVRYTLTIDQLDADRYLPPVGEGNDAAPPTAATGAAAVASSTEEAIPMETLRELDLRGSLQLGKLKISGLNLTEIDTKITAKDGVIRLHPLAAKLYQGEYSGDIKLDARGDQLKLAVNESLQKIQFGPLLKDYMDDDIVSGQGNIEAKLTATGSTPEAITKTLDGTARVSIFDGSSKILDDLFYDGEKKLAQFKGRTSPTETAKRKMKFSELIASFNIKNSVVSNDDLSIKATNYRINGKGTFNLIKEVVDYRVSVTYDNNVNGQDGSDASDLQGLTVPAHVHGPLDNLNYELKITEALEAQAKKLLDNEKARQRAKFEKRKAEEKAKLEAELRRKKEAEEDRIKQKLDDKLKGLFDR